MPLPLYVIDAFADRPFTGNPAAVVPFPGDWPSDAWMQSVAAEMNLSETAFVRPDGGEFGLRWFTPAVEVDLCGHATLAAAHAIWERGESATELRFRTRSGVLTARRVGDTIELDFPLVPATACDPPPGLLESLGVSATFVGRNRMDYIIEVADVRGVRPDFAALTKIPFRGVIVTSAGENGYDFVSRFFAPASGIHEDPVTGSAHCCLADYWGRKLGKTEMVGYQASVRGGVVRVSVRGDRVGLTGTAVTVVEGRLQVVASE